MEEREIFLEDYIEDRERKCEDLVIISLGIKK